MGIKVLIIGHGSIGSKHFKVLRKLKLIEEIKIISKIKNKTLPRIEFKKNEIINYNPDYIIIANETYLHYKTLKFINSIFKDKKILIEKPIFEKQYSLKLYNKVFVNYNLRVHPLIEKMKNIIAKKSFNYVNMTCFSDVLKWRKNIKFSKSYSSSKKKGGGVLKELSHEIDLMYYLFNVKKNLFKYKKKLSNLSGDADDTAVIIAEENNKRLIVISLNYSSQFNYRRIIVSGDNYSLNLDLKKNVLVKTNKKNKYTISSNLNNLDLLQKVHSSIILSKNTCRLCNFQEALKVMKILK